MQVLLKYFTDFTATQLSQFEALEHLYTHWNQQINVISRKDIASLYEKHVLHALSIAAAFHLPPQMQVLDIGTGGGFPGIPLAIFFPEVQFHLVDSIGKKLKVVEAILAATGINNITTAHTRAEDIKDRKFELIVSRAVAPLKDLWTWSRPLLRALKKNNAYLVPTQTPTPNGLICLKGGDLSLEISEANCTPKMMEIHAIFLEDYFKDKHLLYVPFAR
jgi:16S rRNA (guanine527-N7)-methyltransferase